MKRDELTEKQNQRVQALLCACCALHTRCAHERARANLKFIIFLNAVSCKRPRLSVNTKMRLRIDCSALQHFQAASSKETTKVHFSGISQEMRREQKRDQRKSNGIA
jgi:hypothetical protein